jgi:hypothetical protein
VLAVGISSDKQTFPTAVFPPCPTYILLLGITNRSYRNYLSLSLVRRAVRYEIRRTVAFLTSGCLKKAYHRIRESSYENVSIRRPGHEL